MAKRKISKKLEVTSVSEMPIMSLKDDVKTYIHDPNQNLGNAEFIAQALAQCLIEGDKEEFMEILFSHWQVKNKTEALKSVDLAKRTFYDLKKDSNPRLDTIMKLTKGIKTG